MKNPLFRLPENITREVSLALRVNLAFIFGELVTLGFFSFQVYQTPSWQSWMLLSLAVIVFVFGIVGLALILRGRHELGTWLEFIPWLIWLIAISALVSGLGLLLLGCAVIITSLVAGLALPPRQAGPFIVTGVTSGILTLLVDLFIPTERINLAGIQTIISFFLGILLLFFGFVIVRQYRNYSLVAKLLLAFLVIALGSLITVAFLANRSLETNLTKEIINNQTTLANSQAAQVGQIINSEFDKLNGLALSQAVQERAEEASLTEIRPVDVAEIEQLNQAWRAAVAANNNDHLLVAGVIYDKLSPELLKFQKAFPQNVEILLTDQKGFNIAAAYRPAAYYQADALWWRIAHQDGQYIGQPVFDSNSKTIALDMAVTVNSPSNGEFMGVLHTTITFNVITDLLMESLFEQTGHTIVYLPNDQEIGLQKKDDGGYEIYLDFAPSDLRAFVQSINPNMEATSNGVPVMASLANVKSIGNIAGSTDRLKNLGWRVVVLQDRSEALRSVTSQARNIVILSLIIAMIAALAAAGLAQVLAGPIIRLNAFAEKVAAGNLSIKTEVETGDETGTLATTFNNMVSQLSGLIGALEQRVAERTTDLEISRQQSEKRARELQTIGEISGIITSEQKTEILLPLVTRLVGERFDFYHVGIFLVDETGQWAVLQAANSEGGQSMLKRGHKLEVGATGIVGYVTKNGTPRIALDVGADPVFFNNPDLPATRSEMALPLNVRGRVIGALDVQSVKPGAFTENDANTLSILADQVAISIENARLFGRTQDALAEVQNIYRKDIAMSWVKFAQAGGIVGYHKSLIEGKLINKTVDTDEIRQTMMRGSVTTFNADEKRTESTLVVPVKLRGQVIGVLNIRAPRKEHQWSLDEIGLVEAISERLALALENARLFEETAKRAERERRVSDITTKIRSANDPQEMIDTAIEELRQALGATLVEVVPQRLSDMTDK
jgi:GAF domain-containing protein/HAMP domain-containing protein